jgi:tRNA(fMet)-specific endonuclease VapC
MTSYLLDTTAAIALAKGRPQSVSERVIAATDAGAHLTLSSISLLELHYGAVKSARPGHNAIAIQKLLSGALDVLAFDEQDAAEAGAIRAGLEAKGQPIGPYDVLLAGQALRRGLTLVTANLREFRRVPSLQIEDWTKAMH